MKLERWINMRHYDSLLAKAGYIPLDISWTTKMGVLDLVYGGMKEGILEVLENQKELPKELGQLYDVVRKWNNDEVPVESELIYKCLKMASLKRQIKKKIVKAGELVNIDMDEREVGKMSLDKLAQLDPKNGTWAIAYILAHQLENGSVNSYPTIRAYEAVKHWTNKKDGKAWTWTSHYDHTIMRQADAFASIAKCGRINFTVKLPEDYPFARAFELTTPEETQKRLSMYVNETESALAEFDEGKPISSNNDRVVQALAMKSKFYEQPVKINNPDCAKESWPQFWRFLK